MYYSTYIKLQRYHQKLLELFNEFDRASEYKIYVQKSVAFLYSNNLSERGNMKIIPFIIAQKYT